MKYWEEAFILHIRKLTLHIKLVINLQYEDVKGPTQSSGKYFWKVEATMDEVLGVYRDSN